MNLPRLLLLTLLSTVFLLVGPLAQAGSATWKLDPTSNDWNVAGNWVQNTVPNGPADIASFDVSLVTGISVNAGANGSETAVGGLVFNPSASAYTIIVGSSNGEFPYILEINGAGISNDSGAVQHFVTAADGFMPGRLIFFESATAGINVTYENAGGTAASTYGGSLGFLDNSSAGAAIIINDGATAIGVYGGAVAFADSSTAGTATVIANGGTVSGARGGYIQIESPQGVGSGHFVVNGGAVAGADGGNIDLISAQTEGSADDATFTVNGGLASGAGGGTTYVYSVPGGGTFVANGGQVSGAAGGSIHFTGETDLGTARLIANDSVTGAGAATIYLDAKAHGVQAQWQVFGEGAVDISANVSGVVTGSIEGDGSIFLGKNQLTVGHNSLVTTFSGVMQDGGASGGVSGSFRKTGPVTFTLAGASTYTGGTAVDHGALVAANTSGSATGTGAVSVTAGTLGGSGIIAGPVIIGTGSGTGAFLAPAYGGKQQLTLTIQSSLTFNSDATYTYTFKAKGNRSKIDKVVANGVTINSGAQVNLVGTTQGQLTQGTALTLIKNTAATPISGTFSNLPDGAIVNVNGNNLQANYDGGDGNDLTLTVVP